MKTKGIEMKTKTVLLPLTSLEIKLLSETLEMEIQIEEDNCDVNKQLVKHYKKLNEKVCEEQIRFTRDEIGTMCNLSYEQSNHYAYTHEELANNYESLYQKVHALDVNLGKKFDRKDQVVTWMAKEKEAYNTRISLTGETGIYRTGEYTTIKTKDLEFFKIEKFDRKDQVVTIPDSVLQQSIITYIPQVWVNDLMQELDCYKITLPNKADYYVLRSDFPETNLTERLIRLYLWGEN
jgi:hypothetical protein